MKDPGKFMLPVEFEGKGETNGLIDLGASVNLMPLTMFERLRIGELKSTRMQLQLADCSIVYPRGVYEDVLVKVGKFVFPADFVILDMKEDVDMPLIFGRPFLATAKVKIDVFKRVVYVKAYGERIKINMPEWKEKQKEQGGAFLADMMMVWSDESLEDFFRKEGTTKKKEQPPVTKKPSPGAKKKKKPEQEPAKKKSHPWITKFWKEKNSAEKGDYDDDSKKEALQNGLSDYQCYLVERVNGGFSLGGSSAAVDGYSSDEQKGPKKNVRSKVYQDYVCYINDITRNGYSAARFNRYISLEGEDERYPPG